MSLHILLLLPSIKPQRSVFFRTYTYQGPPFTPLRPRDNISYFSSGWTNPPTVDLVALYKTAKGPDDKNLVSRQAWPWGVKSSSALSSWLSQSTVSIVFTHTGWIVSSPNDQDRNSFIWQVTLERLALNYHRWTGIWRLVTGMFYSVQPQCKSLVCLV